MRPAVAFFAIFSVAVCLIPAGAHFFEIFAKLSLPAREYMVVQQIYAGWALFGFAVAAALITTLGYAIVVWREPTARTLSLLAFGAIALTQVIFWTFTYPMNVLTANWTRMPDDLAAARLQWEYSHAINAGFTLIALVLMIAAVLATGHQSKTGREPADDRILREEGRETRHEMARF